MYKKFLPVIGIVFMLFVGFFIKQDEQIKKENIDVEISITVILEGAVYKEGEYYFDRIISVQEMLSNVKLKEDANIESCNLEADIYDGMLIYIPDNNPERVSLNNATSDQLQTIKGIGEVRAKAIMDARPFTCIEDIMKVKGIKEKLYRKLRDYLCL